MCPTFPLRLLSLLPKILFFTLLHFLKFYLSLKGILRCYHLHEVFPDSSSQPLADDGVPSFLSRLSLQMPTISPIDTFYLCLLWLWALWEWKLLGASSVAAMCTLHQNSLNKFLLEISSRKKFGPTDTFVYVLFFRQWEPHMAFPFLPQLPGSLELNYCNHLQVHGNICFSMSVSWSLFFFIVFFLESSVGVGDFYMLNKYSIIACSP